jgi:plasmid stabilization system protein ParE
METAALKVTLAVSARADLRELADYWEEAGEPERAQKYVADLIAAAHSFEDPAIALRGRPPADCSIPDIRQIRVFKRVFRII